MSRKCRSTSSFLAPWNCHFTRHFVFGLPASLGISRLAVLRLLVVFLPIVLIWFLLPPRTLYLLSNTLWLSAGTALISIPWGGSLGILLTRTQLPHRHKALLLLTTLLFIPLYLQCAGWQAGFGLQGWYTTNTMDQAMPLILDGWRGAIWIHAISAVPWVAIMIAAAVCLVEPELEEQALLDTGPLKVFAHVTIRRAATGAIAAALWITATTAGEIAVTDFFLKDSPTFAEEMFLGYSLGDELIQSAAQPHIAILLTGWLVLISVWIAQYLAPQIQLTGYSSVLVFHLPAWLLRFATTITVISIFVLIGIPLCNLAYKAGLMVEQLDGQPIRFWSLSKCITIVVSSPWQYRTEFGWTILIAILSATSVVAIAWPLSWWARRGGLYALPAWIAASTGLATPGPLISNLLTGLLNQAGNPLLNRLYDDTVFAPCVAITIRALPIGILISWLGIVHLPQELLDTAKLDGAGVWRQLTNIVLPKTLPAVCCAWFVAMAFGMGELSASYQVLPPGIDTLSRRVFGLLHAGVEDHVAGICLAQSLLMAIASGAIVLGVKFFQQRHLRERTHL